MTDLEPWIETYTGKYLHFLDPKSDEIDIEDIAHSLSKECRFGGHTREFYSVAEHSLLVATLCPRHLALDGLLHDASEAYLRDIASPIKPHLQNYKEIEHKLMVVIAEKFGFTWPVAPEVREADTMALKAEAHDLLPSKGASWVHQYPTKEEVFVEFKCFSPNVAKKIFLDAYNDLGRKGMWIPPKKEIIIAA